jgi:two-component system sensor histidine kinase TctE
VPQALARRVDLGLAVPDRPIAVMGNPGLLGDALSNLVDNALRHSPEGGHVTIVVEERNGAARLLVEDEGPCIAPAERERVLERFYRIPGSPGEGSGLGLAIVREIALLHGATVVIGENREGRGCSVSLAFPSLERRMK